MTARAIVLLTALALAVRAQDGLDGALKTAHFDIRFRIGSRAEASADRVAALVDGELKRILGELGLTGFDGTIRLCLYDDVAELQRVTGVPAAGFSVPMCSHVPHDNDQTRVHELVHVVAERFRERGPEPRNLFFAEGLANAVLRFVDGVHVDCVAAFHLRRGDLPSIRELHAVSDFYGWLAEHPRVGSYDVAGSWMRFLLDGYGAAKVRRYYKGVSAEAAFDRSVEALEQDWRAHLAEVVLREGTLALLAERLGGAASASEVAAELAALLAPASEWRPVERAALADAAKVSGDGRDLRFELSGQPNEGDWCEARFTGDHSDTALRCTVEALDGCYGVKLQLGGDCQAMVLRGQGAFLYSRGQPAAHDRGVQLGQQATIVLRRRGERASVWIDGRFVFEAEVGDVPARLGIGCVGGAARFRDVAARDL